MFHKLRAHIVCSRCGGKPACHRAPSRAEIDFTWTRVKTSVGIEVKASARWRPEYSRTLLELQDSGTLPSSYRVYLGDTELQDHSVRVLPVGTFLQKLNGGRILPSKAGALECQGPRRCASSIGASGGLGGETGLSRACATAAAGTMNFS